jgi:preprotein translocase subunit SecD
VGPNLGADSIAAGKKATLIGVALIFLFMALYYRTLGIVADIALSLNVLFLLAILTSLGATLTLPGVAAIALTVGMAVDANILLSERLKEELHEGKNLREAIASAWTRAWTSIRDGNLSSIITAILLYIIGTMLIKGFAVTFGLGVVVSLLVAVLVSRVLLVAISPVKLGRVGQFFFSSGFHTK